MSLERKANKVLAEARELSGNVATWADFSAKLFNGFRGTVATTFPNEMERQAFFDSEQYKEIRKILLGLMKKQGVVEGSKLSEEKSGKFVVRVPKSVHLSLEEEAKDEGVSLNQLAVAKLSIPLKSNAEKEKAKRLVIRSFNAVHEGFSPDWVILEPHHNKLFLSRCRSSGLDFLDEYSLNHLLMHVRKDPKYKGELNSTTKRSGFSDYDDCFFAAEIAIRTLQRTRGVTLDQVLCDPSLRSQFDDMATQYAPGQTDLKLRCAALNLRKTHKLKPAVFDLANYDLVPAEPVRRISLSKIVELPGTYVFFDQNRPLYAGETENLRKRIDSHLNAGLPEWLDVNSDDSYLLKTLVMPSTSKDQRLSWLGAFINKERPVLNYQKAA